MSDVVDRIKQFRVRFFNQAEAMDAVKLDAGPCVAFCLLWIAHHKNYRTGSTREPTDVRMNWIAQDQTVRTACAMFNFMHTNYQSKEQHVLLEKEWRAVEKNLIPTKSDYELMILSRQNLINHRVVCNRVSRKNLDHIANLVNNVHQYYIIFMTDTGTTATDHAICCYKSSGKIFGFGQHFYIFDPNSGEYVIDGTPEAFLSFFQLLLQTYDDMGGNHRSFDVRAIDSYALIPT